MVPLSPALLIANATTFIGLDCKPRGDEMSATFVGHLGFWSHYDLRVGRSTWPLPRTRTVNELAAAALRADLLRESARFGDIFLLWSTVDKKFVRAGIVMSAEEHFENGDLYAV